MVSWFALKSMHMFDCCQFASARSGAVHSSLAYGSRKVFGSVHCSRDRSLVISCTHANTVVLPLPSGMASMYVLLPPCVVPGPELGVSHSTLNARGSTALAAAAIPTKATQPTMVRDRLPRIPEGYPEQNRTKLFETVLAPRKMTHQISVCHAESI